MRFFDNLSSEILLHILFLSLSPVQACICSSVSRNWNTIVKEFATIYLKQINFFIPPLTLNKQWLIFQTEVSINHACTSAMLAFTRVHKHFILYLIRASILKKRNVALTINFRYRVPYGR